MEIIRVNRIQPEKAEPQPQPPAAKPKAEKPKAAEPKKKKPPKQKTPSEGQPEPAKPDPEAASKAAAKKKKQAKKRLRRGSWPHVEEISAAERTKEQRQLLRAIDNLQHLTFRLVWQGRGKLDLPQLQLFCEEIAKKLKDITAAVAGTELKPVKEHDPAAPNHEWTEQQKRVVEAGYRAHQAAYRANKIARLTFDREAAKQATQDAIVAMAGVLGAFEPTD